MKKLVILILILVVIPLITTEDTPSFYKAQQPNPNKDQNWEYVKDRLFDKKSSIVEKREGPILFDLEGASIKDSLIVKEIINELHKLLPNKTIEFFDTYTGKSKESLLKNKPSYETIIVDDINFGDLMNRNTIRLFFETKLFKKYHRGRSTITTLLNDDNYIQRFTWFNKLNYRFWQTNIYFGLNDELDINERKKFIRYEMLRSLCFIQKHKEINFYQPVNAVFNSDEYKPENYEFTEMDQFLLQKLYKKDFLDQFKEYMYNTYPRRYVNNFLYKSKTKILAITIIILVGIVLFILAFGMLYKIKLKYDYLNYLIPIYLIFISFFSLYMIYDYIVYFNAIRTLESYVQSILGLGLLQAILISFVLWGLEKLFVKKHQSFYLSLVLKTVFTLLAFILPFLMIFIIDSNFQSNLESFVPIVIIITGITFVRGILTYLNFFSDSLLKEKNVELSRLRELKTNAELKSLQSQINPHFLYNALNSIASLAPVDSVKTQKMAHSLSDLFKYTINRKGKKMSTVSDEVIMVQNYLDIEKIRFGDRLQFTIDVDTELEKVEIPLFIIQPLVENAVKHGISKIEGEGIIALKIEKTITGILIEVKDNGPNFPEGLVSGHGLQTVFDLLRLTYGDKAILNWKNTPEKSITVTITQNT